MVEILTPRDVPLGGLRAMTVRRTLPQRQRSLIGAWCFLDHYGPDRVDETGGMEVPPHPHIGLQTVSWLFGGTVEHRDSLGTHAAGQARRAQPDDGRAGHLPLRDLDRRDHRAARRPAVAGAARRPPRRRSRRSPTTPRPSSTATAGTPWCSSAPCSAAPSPVESFTPLVGAELILDGGTRLSPEPDADVRVRRAGRLRDRARQRRGGQPSTSSPTSLRGSPSTSRRPTPRTSSCSADDPSARRS